MTEFIRKRTKNAKNDILSGLTVALALVPEAVAFAFVAGVDPLVGLYAAFMIGLITAVFGGRPGMISGATGALAVVMVSLVSDGNALGAEGENLGLYYLFICYGYFNGNYTNVGRYFEARKVCSFNSTPSYDGICKWFGHSDILVSTRNV